MKTIDVIFSPELYPFYPNEDSVVVMVDAIRASATLVTAFHNGLEHAVPMADIEQTRKMKQQGYLVSAERNAEKVAGFDKGNSPYEYMHDLRGQKLAITTTNGTRAIHMARHYSELLIGSFIHYAALQEKILAGRPGRVLVLCSGWKGKTNIEDILFGGKLCEALITKAGYSPGTDAAQIARTLYSGSKENLYEAVVHYSPRLAQKTATLGKDMHYCLREQNLTAIPYLRDEKLFVA